MDQASGPIDNRDLMEWLFDQEQIALRRSPWLQEGPPPLPTALPWDRVEGMLLGLAIGDSLGNVSEGLIPDERRSRWGEIWDYLPHPHAGGRRVGLPSDDTQLAFWTLEQLLQDRGLLPERLAERFSRELIFGLGGTVRTFLRNRQLGASWYEAGPRQDAAGNGALMRIAPVLVPHLRSGTAALWADTAIAAMLTHNDPASTAACLALVSLLWEVLRREVAPAPYWWLETFCGTMRELEGETTCYRTRTPDLPYVGPVWRFAEEQVTRALEERLPVRTACDQWYSGAYLLETVPSVLYLLCRYGHDPEEALVRAVNDTRDNDTVGAIVGAVVGALHGAEALPLRWRQGLLGRTGAEDDGTAFRLIDAAQSTAFAGPLPAKGPPVAANRRRQN